MHDGFPLVRITKIVAGGQGFGQLPDGKNIFVWNALPGEEVRVRVLKQRHTYAEGIASEVIHASPERIEPREVNYLATSPWQIMTFDAENRYKKDIVEEVLQQHNVVADAVCGTTYGACEWQYRNKMEYSFWGDDAGLHLALYQRGSHGKQVVTGSALAMPAVDAGADSIRVLLDRTGVRASQLKTIIVRSTLQGATAASLFVKDKLFPELELPSALQGLRVYYSNPKSPASVRTGLLYERGSVELSDVLLGRQFHYDTDSFFQVNVPAFELALQRIKEKFVANELVDLYAGVGSIGLSVATGSAELVEVDPATVAMARRNAAVPETPMKVVEASVEQSLQRITHEKPVIFDPPRAGLHKRVVRRVLEALPPRLAYLSCNPVTQARDMALLQKAYRIAYYEVFNFFPRTPHIEALAILERQ